MQFLPSEHLSLPFSVLSVIWLSLESCKDLRITGAFGSREVPVPRVEPEERYLITELDYNGFYRCVCRYGYAAVATVPLNAGLLHPCPS